MTAKFEEITKSLKELRTSAELCNKDTIEKTSSISSIIENSFSRNEFTEKQYIELKKMKLDIINIHKNKCLCINKDNIGTELRKVLLRYKYI